MPAKKNLINQRFGKLLVISEVPKDQRKNKKQVEWLCQCDCGNTTVTITSYLTSGHTKSCGCLRKELPQMNFTVDISGQKFGKLLALESLKSLGSDKTKIWKCQCDCGNFHYTTLNQLRTGQVQSCGCQRSRGETTIKALLEEMSISFKTQFWFDDLRGNKMPLFFDFAIFDNGALKCLIEYQGEQHYVDTTRGHWKSPVEHDNLKRQYCAKNNIRLIEIPFTDFNKLSKEYLLKKIGF